MNKKILVVDDDASVRRLLVDFLKHPARTLFEAADGKEAVSIAGREHPQLVLLDVMMPVMNGLDALKEIRQNSPASSVVMLSAVHEEDTAQKAIRLGAYDYLAKPLRLDTLKNFVSRILGED